jgi:hypothetical protein
MRAALALLLVLLLPASARADHAEARGDPPTVPVPRPPQVAGELQTPRFLLLHTEAAGGSARALAGLVEQARDDVARTLGRDWPGVTEVRVGVGRAEFEALALPGGAPPPWAAALAYPAHGIVLLDGRAVGTAEGARELRHELVHVALGAFGRGWPRWFQEGLALEGSGERYVFQRYVALVKAVHSERVLDLQAMEGAWHGDRDQVELAYAQSQAFVAHLLSLHGPSGFEALFAAVGRGVPFEEAFIEAFHESLGTAWHEWSATLPRRYAWTPLLAGSTTLLAVAAWITVIGWMFRRRRYARALEQMALREQAEEAARRILEAEELARAAAAFAEQYPGDPDEETGGQREPGEDEGPPPGTLLH